MSDALLGFATFIGVVAAGAMRRELVKVEIKIASQRGAKSGAKSGAPRGFEGTAPLYLSATY